MTAMVLPNRLRRTVHYGSVDPAVWAFHRRMPAYAPTAVYDVPAIASAFDVGRVLVKAELQRLGLPSFKILGASWATYQAICDRLGHAPEPWLNINALATRLAPMRPFTLAAATDGNHGRAVAFMARLLGFDAHMFVPAGTVDERMHAIRCEGATVTVVDGDYDAAVAHSAREASERCLVISDTSWPRLRDHSRTCHRGVQHDFRRDRRRPERRRSRLARRRLRPRRRRRVDGCRRQPLSRRPRRAHPHRR